MNRFEKVSGLLFIIIITIIGGTTVQNFINDEHIIMAQEVEGPGLNPIDPKNVTEQILMEYPSENKNISTGLGNNLTNS